jgi:hypothetical protein
LVDYNGRECVLKIINNYIDFDGNISDKSILVYEKLLGFKNNLPKGWDRYIPEIYFMGRNCKILAPENVIKLKSLRDAKKIFQNKTFDVIIMEKLNPLSKVPGLTESMDGYAKNSPDIGIITLDMINEHFNQIKEIIEDISNKSPKNIIIKFDDSEKNTSKVNVGKIIFDAYIDYDIDANEFLKEHIDSKNPDLRIMEDKTSWFEERIWLNFDFKSFDSIKILNYCKSSRIITRNLKNSKFAKKRISEEYTGPLCSMILSLDFPYSDGDGGDLTLKDVIPGKSGDEDPDFNDVISFLSKDDPVLKKFFNG